MNEEALPNAASPRPRKRSCLRSLFKLFFYFVVLVALLGVAAGLGAYLAYDYVTRPGSSGATVRIEVPEGATARQVGMLLAEKDLIEHEIFFRFAIRLDKSNKAIQHGSYDLKRGLSPLQLLHLLYEGPNVVEAQFKLTVPEGLSLAQTAKFFDDPPSFVTAASDPVLIASLNVNATTLEGFLAPDTYFFTEKPTPQAAAQRMVEQFRKRYQALVKEYPDAASKDLLEVITVASLVEEESRVEEERPVVAAVIYNRLAKHMPLGLDSTLQYALGKYGQRMLDTDKDVDSPYNTYKYTGLPPGPIASPGVASLRAALRPAEVEYLYFVSNADGKTHTFSATLDEHNRAVARFRKGIAVQRRQQQDQVEGAKQTP
jgi:UPF0755 protein